MSFDPSQVRPMGGGKEQRTVVLTRDVVSRQVPDGNLVTLPANTFVNITQALGGTYTLTYRGNMYRVDGTDADALGQKPLDFHFDPPEADGSVREADIERALDSVYDPEIPVSVLSLGLIYEREVIKRDGKNVVRINMTLTAPTCGMGPVLVGDVKTRVSLVPNVDEVDVELVFSPPWSRDMMSEEALLELGLF